ncbi:hypothetical protein [Campylobacter helveticus]|uniref:Uncharacterized protein n=1 Tax=Campylobacter helveticus TaxID=28898 RepID=A0AAX2UKD0_9BACT|nr:hypothetical protein [Campylobacter helveticus]ARE81051.1 hypothetical protein CHELV3228_1481 [Campylobacter helveticus]MCR2054069.1 hypothetical protein [Campylobacter helveticus]MCR2062596.1 hypothetical protein [Campylobacter helveticus]QBL12459.1 hypothetical protein A0073_08715 [Campylobacter helveticus]TNB57117.1 hypothetical protein FDW47_00710 [Campylobacter helveticus]
MDKLTNNLNISLPSSQNATNRKEILELKKEEQNKVKVDDISNAKSGFKVVFENKEGELMALRISEENYKNLQEHFSSYTNYIARDDNSIRLNGEANEFVANWFEKISSAFFNPTSLNNDKDSEYISVNFHKKTTLESLQNLAFKGEDSLTKNANLEEKLNFALEKDVNLDGSVNEFDVKKQSLTEILRDLKNASGESADASKMQDTQKKVESDDKDKIKEKKDEEEKTPLEKALEEGLESLSQEEKAQLESSHPQKFEELKRQELEQNLSKDFKEQILRGESPLVDKFV